MVLNPQQFYIEHQEQSPLLDYAKGPAERAIIRHPDAEPSSVYMAETQRIEKYGATGKPLKKPKVIKTPGAGPNAAGFVDYQLMGDLGERDPSKPASLYVSYMKSEHPGSGVPDRLLDSIVEKHAPIDYVNFGKIMNPRIVHVMSRFAERHPDIALNGHNDFDRRDANSPESELLNQLKQRRR
jgi:hypothetical protein